MSIDAEIRVSREPHLTPLACCPEFDVTEKSILELQAAQAEGWITGRGIVEQYLARIRAYDQAGPALNAMVTLNPEALEVADALDRERKRQGPRGPLHGIPLVIKDNFETREMPTSGGTLALANFWPMRDAFQVERLRQAGAILLGKTTLHELSAGITTVSSFTGQTRNPYDLHRVPGGSSGGTAVAVAASFAAAGMGSDTCGSIRIPACNQNLVGLRVTRGLSSRSGIIPLSPTQDEAGPLARSVADLALMLDATVGPDPNDPITRDAARHIPPSYFARLTDAALQGKRIGVLSRLFGEDPEESEVAAIVRNALDEMKRHGVELIELEALEIPGLDALMQGADVIVHEFKFALADYLAGFPSAPIKSLQEILDKRLHHEQLKATFLLRNQASERESEAYRAARDMRLQLREALISLHRSRQLDALAYPVLRRKATLIGQKQHGITSQLSAYSGLPAISMPAGFTEDGVPVGIELLALPYQETALLQIAHAWEKTARLRRPPFSTPPLMDRVAPPPLKCCVTIGSCGSGPAAELEFLYDRSTGRLSWKALAKRTESTESTASTDLVAVTLQNGPVLAHLLKAGQQSAESGIHLDARDRAALMNGALSVHLYTKQDPLGAAQGRLEMLEVPHVAHVRPFLR